MNNMDMNKVFIIGRLVRDAELKYTANGQPVSKFSLAINEKKKEGDNWVDDVSYVDITFWGKQAESLDQYLTKGKQIAVDGKLKQERWTDRDTGNNRSKIGIVAFNIQLLGSGKDSGESNSGYSGENYGGGYSSGGYSGGSSRASAPASRTAGGPPIEPGYMTPPRAPAQASAPADDDGFTDDIPF
jgi:single-strand DNA-binding protein